MTSATTTARPPAQDLDDAVDAAIEQAARELVGAVLTARESILERH